MGLDYARLFASNTPSFLKTSVFGGIAQAADENDLKISSSCFSPRALNFCIDRGNLTTRNNYEPVTPSEIRLNNDGYTYKIKSMFVHASAAPILLAGCEAYTDTAMMPPAHHCSLLRRKLDLSDSWNAVTCAPRRSFGSGLDLYFQNADFTFTNYSGDFYEDGTEVFATILANGADTPMFFTPDGLSALKSDGWFSTTADGNAHTLTNGPNSDAAVGDAVQVFSRTLTMPAGLKANTTYYVLTLSDEGKFLIGLTRNLGSQINFTTPSNNYNLMARVVSETSAWVATSADTGTISFKADNLARNGDTVEFRSTSYSMPKGLAAGKMYYVINCPLNNDPAKSDYFQVCETKGGSSATVCANSASTDTLTICLQRSYTGTMTVNPQSTNSDTMSVTKNDKDLSITINLANMTAANNTADKIQAAIRAFGTVGAAHVEMATCTAGGNWNTAAIASGMDNAVTFSHVDAVSITSGGSNLYTRVVNARHGDAPIGSNIFVHSDRLWMNVGNTLYHNAGYYDSAAHPVDWVKDGYAGSIPIPTWDGDVIRVAKTENGQPWVCKENSVWSIDGYAPPYTVRQLFTAKGTIAPKSVVWYTGCLFYAAEEGILQFDGATTRPYLTTDIKKLWYRQNKNCVCNIAGDTLFVYGLFYHPFNVDSSGNPVLGSGMLAVDIPTKNICFHDLNAYANFSASKNMLMATNNGSTATPALTQATGTPWVAGHVLYARAICSVTNGQAQSIALSLAGTTGSAAVITLNSPTPGAQCRLYGNAILPAGTGNVSVKSVTTFASAATANGKTEQMQYTLAVDLTALFGAGNEPSADAFESLISIYNANNIVSNGNFASTSGWTGTGATLSASGNMLTLTNSGSVTPTVSQATNTPWAAGHVFYARAQLTVTSGSAQSFALYLAGATASATVASQRAMALVTQYTLSGNAMLPADTGNISIQVVSTYPDLATANGKAEQIRYALAVDLTAIFGAGNEPSASEFEAALAAYAASSWFDGQASLPFCGRLVKLECNSVLEPWFTALRADVDSPQHWFASGSRIYRYSPLPPAPGSAPAMKYCIPQSDFGTASYRKDISLLTLTGRGGACKIIPVVDGTAMVSPPYPYTVTLPTAVGVIDLPVSGVAGRLIGWIVENVSGSAIEIHDMEVTYERSRG